MLSAYTKYILHYTLIASYSATKDITYLLNVETLYGKSIVSILYLPKVLQVVLTVSLISSISNCLSLQITKLPTIVKIIRYTDTQQDLLSTPSQMTIAFTQF